MEVYRAGEKQRIPEEQLKISGLYVVRLALTEAFKKKANLTTNLEAFHLPARINAKNAPLPDRYMVDFSLLDQDLNVLRAISGQIRGGYILGREEEHGYFKEYEDGCAELEAVKAELADIMPIAPDMGTELPAPMPMAA